jgi:hypothetical protein
VSSQESTCLSRKVVLALSHDRKQATQEARQGQRGAERASQKARGARADDLQASQRKGETQLAACDAHRRGNRDSCQGVGSMIAAGATFGHLTVIEELSSSDAGFSTKEGSWCRVRCDCGRRCLKRSRHLRRGGVTNCGSMACQFHRALKIANSALGGLARAALRASRGAA